MNCFLNFTFWYSFLAGRNAIDFCILTSLYLICHEQIRDSFLSTILVWMCFMTFPWQIVLYSTCGTMVSRSDESEHPWLVLNISEKAFSFSSLNIILVVRLFCSYSLLIWRQSHLSLSFECFEWKDIEFCQMLFLCLLSDDSPFFINVMLHWINQS